MSISLAFFQFLINFSLLYISLPVWAAVQEYKISLFEPNNCVTFENGTFHHFFFDTTAFRCRQCAQNKTYQTVSNDYVSCQCQFDNRIVKDFGAGEIECVPCASGQVGSADGWSCIDCGISGDPACSTCENPATDVLVEKNADGDFFAGSETRECATCVSFYKPDKTGRSCQRCTEVLRIFPEQNDCVCPASQVTGGVCFFETLHIVENTPTLYSVDFAGTRFDSAFFFAHLRAAVGMCGDPYFNLTACQILSNMCVLILYTLDNNDLTSSSDACSHYLRIFNLQNELVGNLYEWRMHLPWLYYFEEIPSVLLTDDVIPTEYNFSNNTLRLVAAVFTVNGSFLGYQNVTAGKLQLCPDAVQRLNAAWTFGLHYIQKCSLQASELFSKETMFFELFHEFEEDTVNGTVRYLYPIPIRITNFKHLGSSLNQDVASARYRGHLISNSWQLTRRFFLVDTISGFGTEPYVASDGTTIPQAVRYAQKIKVWVSLQSKQFSGRIYPPHVSITYGVITAQDYEDNKFFPIEFEVRYRQPYDDTITNYIAFLSVAVSIAILYGIFRTCTWSKRNSRKVIDFPFLAHFFFNSCGPVANWMFFVTAGFAFWVWVTVKFQRFSTSLFAPDDAQETLFVLILYITFAIKLTELLYVLSKQVSVDIFLVDWEQPRSKLMNQKYTRRQQGSDAGHGEEVQPVSIWRTYFVANEWNEIQTHRKISEVFQMALTVVILETAQVSNLASDDPYLRTNDMGGEVYISPHNTMFRFLWIALIYISIYVAQWFYYMIFYRLYVGDPPGEFTDLCSVCNISVLIMSEKSFGYYIHGRSVHGMADTGLREMTECLAREGTDKTARRGLLPGSDVQTFEMLLPENFRVPYDKVMMPIFALKETAPSSLVLDEKVDERQANLDIRTIKFVDGYELLNRYFQSFIDHKVRDVDYQVVSKTTTELILDTEFGEISPEFGTLYSDNSSNFTKVVWYGIETTLSVFFLLLLIVCDLLFGNIIIAAVTTLAVEWLLRAIRYSLGLRNLTRKTLVDERFLI